MLPRGKVRRRRSLHVKRAVMKDENLEGGTGSISNGVGAAPARRDFLHVSLGAMVAVGGAAAMWPLIDQMNPNAATVARESRIVDLAPIRPGQAVTLQWRGQPVVIRHRTRDEIESARSVQVGDLPDPFARNAALAGDAPASDANRTHARFPEWLIVGGICTHLGCRLTAMSQIEHGGGAGWICPCHAARFDSSGRVRSGPARTNLPVPRYRFLAQGMIEIGGA